MRIQKVSSSDNIHAPGEYMYKIHDHCKDSDTLRKWRDEIKLDCLIYSNVAYFNTETDAMFFILRWQ